MILHIFPTHNGYSERVDLTWQHGDEPLSDSWSYFNRSLPRDTVFEVLASSRARAQYDDIVYHNTPYTV